jgi:hypothetical protein
VACITAGGVSLFCTPLIKAAMNAAEEFVVISIVHQPAIAKR